MLLVELSSVWKKKYNFIQTNPWHMWKKRENKSTNILWVVRLSTLLFVVIFISALFAIYHVLSLGEMRCERKIASYLENYCVLAASWSIFNLLSFLLCCHVHWHHHNNNMNKILWLFDVDFACNRHVQALHLIFNNKKSIRVKQKIK